MLFMIMGCASYERYNPSPVGVFYPNSTIQYVFMEDNSLRNHVIISFSQPVKIKSLGIMTNYNSSIKECEVALLESPKLDHLPGDYISTSDNFFAPTRVLKFFGRIEYTGTKTSSDFFWEGVGSFLASTFGIVLDIILIIIIAISFYKRRGSKSSTISSSYNGGSYSSDSYSSYSSEYDSIETYEGDEHDQESEVTIRNSGTYETRRCRDCQNIDLSGLGFNSKGNGRCRKCDGTGHDNLTETIVQLGTFGTVDDKYDCKTCYGTGQCQTCGGTGIEYY